MFHVTVGAFPAEPVVTGTSRQHYGYMGRAAGFGEPNSTENLVISDATTATKHQHIIYIFICLFCGNSSNTMHHVYFHRPTKREYF